jgi:hypothetical protein
LLDHLASNRKRSPQAQAEGSLTTSLKAMYGQWARGNSPTRPRTVGTVILSNQGLGYPLA